jgi:hypothetical protein
MNGVTTGRARLAAFLLPYASARVRTRPKTTELSHFAPARSAIRTHRAVPRSGFFDASNCCVFMTGSRLPFS